MYTHFNLAACLQFHYYSHKTPPFLFDIISHAHGSPGMIMTHLVLLSFLLQKPYPMETSHSFQNPHTPTCHIQTYLCVRL